MVKKRKQIFSGIISILLAVAIMVTSNGIMAMAEDIQTTGQNLSVIEISSVDDLQKIAEDLQGNYILTEDLDLSSVDYIPIGNNEEPFRGTLDGGGHVIFNLNILVKDSEESSFAGLFGTVENATIVNLAIENCIIRSETSGGVYVGAIAGKMQNSLIEDVYVSGQINVEGNASYSVGGIVGAVFQNGDDETLPLEYNVARCVSSVEIDVQEDVNGEKGVLAGYVEDTALIENSYSLIPDMDLFGVEVSENNSCKLLGENTWGKENSYIGFDFENVWNVTDGGARLISQKYEKTEETEDVVEEDAYGTDGLETTVEHETENLKEEKKKDVESSAEKDQKVPEESNNKMEDPDKGIALLDSNDSASGDYTYQVFGNNITITGYNGSGGNIVIPDTIDGYNVTAIGNSAFSGKDSITGVTFSTTKLSSIGYYAFRGTHISSITIPKTVTSCDSYVDNGPFSGATQLKEVTFEEGMARIPADVLASGSNTSYVTKVNMPDSINTIGGAAFYKCVSIKGMELSKGLTTIEGGAYSGCSGLEGISFPETLTTIGGSAFANSGLKTVTLPSSIQTVGGSSFSGCGSLQSVNFTEKDANGYQASVGDYAFSGCGSLTGVNFSVNVTSIGEAAFDSCSSLKEITIPQKVVSIGERAFQGCIGLERIELPDGLENIDQRAFWYCSALTSIKIPDGVTEISYGAFADCSSLENITFPERLTGMEYFAFSRCSSLKNIVLPEGITDIKQGAFEYCTNMESIILPESLISIDAGVFEGCERLEEIRLPQNVRDVYIDAFGNGENISLKNIDVDSRNINYSSEEGVLYNKEKTSLLCYPNGKKENTFTIPDSVQHIGHRAFYRHEYLTNITIPQTVTDIDSIAFEGGKLKDITILNKECVFYEDEDPDFLCISSDAVIHGYPGSTAEAYAKKYNHTFKAIEEQSGNKTPVSDHETGKNVKVSKIKISGLSHKIAVGKSMTLKAEVLPLNASNKGITWESGNKKYVTVNSRGKVTVRKSGKTVTITAAAQDGSGKKATYKITPVKNKVKKIIISGKKKVKAGRSLQLTVKVTATGKSANKTVTWKSSNDKYAMVNKKGKVTAKKAGKGKKVKITALATDGSGKKKSIIIKIQ